MISRTMDAYLGDMGVKVTYDLQPAEAQTFEYPGCEAEIMICSVLINGVEINPDCFSDSQIARWVDMVFETE